MFKNKLIYQIYVEPLQLTFLFINSNLVWIALFKY